MAPTCQCQIAYSKAPPFRTEVAPCLVASDPRGAMMTGGAILPQTALTFSLGLIRWCLSETHSHRVRETYLGSAFR